MGESYIPDHQNIYLLSSFLGSNRWASEQISDSLAIAAAYGPPTFSSHLHATQIGPRSETNYDLVKILLMCLLLWHVYFDKNWPPWN